MKTHDREFFYKYTSAHRGLDVLTNLTVWWCSPLLFNDPFDTHFSLNYGFPLDAFADAMASRVQQLVQSDEPLSPAANPTLATSVLLCRLLRKHGHADKVFSGLKEALQTGADDVKQSLHLVAEGWREWLRSMRVFCVSEVHDDLLMWAHYADCHRGVVIKLRCLREKDTALCAARPIQYQADIPVLARTVEEWVAHVCGDHRLDFDDIFGRLAFTKSEHWVYEKEWRCWIGNGVPSKAPEPLAEPNLLFAEEIAAVYLGCRMGDDQREAITRLVRERFGAAKLFQARTSTSAFRLEFDETA
jgi:hypothetical protein